MRAGLVAVVQAVLDRHDMLRARLTTSPDGSWGLAVPEAGTVRAEGCVTRVDVESLDDAGLERVMGEQATAALDRLDPGAGVLVQVVWFDPGAGGPHRVLWTVHHLAVDGVSWRIILSDLNTAWDAAAGGVVALAGVPVSFRGWAGASG